MAKENDEKPPKDKVRHKKDEHKGSREGTRGDGDKERQKAPASYGPEFLRAFARAGTPKERGSENFAVIAGAEARRFARRFVQEQSSADAADGQAETDATDTDAKGKTKATALDTSTDRDRLRRIVPPVVFALPHVGDAGRKLVDYYMTWRGKTKTTPLKGLTRRAGFLDSEFRRVRETLDGEWRRASRVLKGLPAPSDDGGDGGARLKRAPTDPQKPPRLPPLLAAYAREEQEKEEGGPAAAPTATTRSISDPFPLPSSFPINLERPALGSHRGSVDSLNSVTSLPLLGMVRGVPVGNRIPLRVTNPSDRMSMTSSSGSVDVPTARPAHASPLREGVTFVAPGWAEGATTHTASEGGASATTHVVRLPGHTVSDSSASSSGSSRKSKSKKERRVKETTPAIDGDDQEKILIVLLDDKDDRTRKLNDDESWHGLERRISTRSTSGKSTPPSSAHVSPWLGPLMHLEEDVTYVHTAEHSDDYDSEPEPEQSTVAPIQSLLFSLGSLGYLSPEAAVRAGAPSPYGSYTSLPSAYGSPSAGTAPLVGYSNPYGSPSQGSPYRAAYPMLSPSRSHTPPSPLTHAQSPWASPGGGASLGYPPTNYVSPSQAGYMSPYASPAPAGYASPYASPAPAGYASPYASPAPVGYGSPYASPSAAYMSPAAGYSNVAADYSSPYVSSLYTGMPLSRPASASSLYRG